VRPIEVAPGLLRFQLDPGFRAEDPEPEFRDALFKITGERWTVERAVGNAEPSLRERAEAEATAAQAALLADPLVKAAFAAFPDAELVDEERQTPGRNPWSKSA